MFLFLSIVWIAAVLRFGGVEPHVGLTLAFVLTAGLAAFALVRLLREPKETSSAGLAGAAALAIGVAAFVDPILALGPMAGVTAWAAARRSPVAVTRFLKVLLAVGVFEALLGLWQYLVAPGWIFGYLNTHYDTSGTLINRNHFAGLLGMLIPVALGLAYLAWLRHRDPGRAYVCLLGASLMGLALVFSLSRMGIFSLFATLVLLALLVAFHSLRTATVLLAVPVLLLAGGALWIGIDVVVDRYDRLIDQDGTIQESRVAVFRDTLQLIADHPMGIGAGAYRDWFRQYQTERNDLLFTHAHNDYLETAAEWGLPIAVAFWLGVLLIFSRAARAFTRTREPDRLASLLAALGGIGYILVHSLTDFNLQIPSNAMLFFTFLGLALALPTAGSMKRTERVSP